MKIGFILPAGDDGELGRPPSYGEIRRLALEEPAPWTGTAFTMTYLRCGCIFRPGRSTVSSGPALTWAWPDFATV